MSLRSGARMQPVSTNEFAVPPGATRGVPGPIGPDKTKMKKGTAVITLDELERIRNQCSLTQDTTAQQLKQTQAKMLQERCKDKT